ncbi:TetR/AcrR family transcriptional regulator [Glaciibacter superstes]|uniref:TetR/AcrR family transcriptional regulator n=1 Tax=Glaciibacter superstes TaxID=501023 RepID=UPI0004221138|nr:TetR/AcrR family transcriptional regulator [Glaciibacter superstes]
MTARSDEKRQQILSATLDVFLANGYVGTSTDQIAAASSISKQTIYKYFSDKQGLFTALITDLADGIHNPFEQLIPDMTKSPDAQSAVTLLAEQFTRSILSPRVQEIRRLVIAEATRFPELGRLYWQSGFERMLDSMAACLLILSGRGLLSTPDPLLAAQHLTGMLLWIPSNRIMFTGEAGTPSRKELTHYINQGARAFVRAYAPDRAYSPDKKE